MPPDPSPTPVLSCGVRVTKSLVEGPTPAQRALAADAKPRTPLRPSEERLFELFGVIEDVLPVDLSSRYGALLQEIAEDQEYDGVTYLGLLRAPLDGTCGPEDEGGLLSHILRQWAIWRQMRKGGDVPNGLGPFPPETLADRDVTDAQVLQGIINGTLSRAWARFVEASPGTGDTLHRADLYALGQHESDQLLNDAGKAILLLQQKDIVLDGHVLHLLLPNPHQRPSPLMFVIRRLNLLSVFHRINPEPSA